MVEYSKSAIASDGDEFPAIWCVTEESRSRGVCRECQYKINTTEESETYEQDVLSVFAP